MSGRWAQWNTLEKVSVRTMENEAQTNYLIQFWGRVLEEAGKESGMSGPSVEVAGCDPVNDKQCQREQCVANHALNSLPIKQVKCHSVYARGQA